MTKLGADPKKDVLISEGHSIDMIVLWKSKQVAVEVDGPSHFLSGHRVHLATGATLLKHRQLRALGWHLVVVPNWEWHEVQGSNAKRHEYLLCLLRQAASDELFQVAHPSGAEKNARTMQPHN